MGGTVEGILTAPQAGLAAGDGLLVVPAVTTLSAYAVTVPEPPTLILLIIGLIFWFLKVVRSSSPVQCVTISRQALAVIVFRSLNFRHVVLRLLFDAAGRRTAGRGRNCR
jgi:hypothetical protein